MTRVFYLALIMDIEGVRIRAASPDFVSRRLA